jgi:hypothetical protein
MHIWQSKRVLKTGTKWQVPSWVKNRPKGVATADWEKDVKQWKIEKLTVLDKLSKTRKASKNLKSDE